MKFRKIVEDILSTEEEKKEKIADISKDELFLILIASKHAWKNIGVKVDVDPPKTPTELVDVDKAIELILAGETLVKDAGLFGISTELLSLIQDTKKVKKIVVEYLKETSEKWFKPTREMRAANRGQDVLDNFK